MTALGMTHTPAVVLGRIVRLTDEIQFNLLHNRVETEASIVYAQPGPIGEWSWIPWQTIQVGVSRNKPFQQAISHMTGGHGAWGSVVIDDQGQIALDAEYAVVAAANHFARSRSGADGAACPSPAGPGRPEHADGRRSAGPPSFR
ncbi:hypothetical protein ACFYWP_33920 [Actinacidiphila glaucinigra]|uniref:hypothetical protein n=1 Tax=Actinacidiphila glaucinigra TaxID=235986 RepID=UPI0036913575